MSKLRNDLKKALEFCDYVNDGSITANINELIQQAWTSDWDEEILKDFYEGEKPERYTADFRDHWIDNENFEEY